MGTYLVWSANDQAAFSVEQERLEKRATEGHGTYLMWSADRRTTPPGEQKQMGNRSAAQDQAPPHGERPPPLVKKKRLENWTMGRRGKYFVLAAVLLVVAFAYHVISQADSPPREQAKLTKAFLSHQIFQQIKDTYSLANPKRPTGMIALALHDIDRAQQNLKNLRDSIDALSNPPKHYMDGLDLVRAELADTKNDLAMAWAQSSDISDQAENYLKETPVADEKIQAVLADLDRCGENLEKALDKFKVMVLHAKEVQKELYAFPDLFGQSVIGMTGIVKDIGNAHSAAKASYDSITRLRISLKNTLQGDLDQGLDPDTLSRLDGVLLLMPERGNAPETNPMGSGRRAYREPMN